MYSDLTEQEQFFYIHAGYSYSAPETADEGHERSARQYAAAETWAREQGYEFRWMDDWMVGDHVAEFDCYSEDGQGPETCEACLMVDPKRPGKVLASLGCIDDATSAYRRVVESELAWEIMPEPMPAGSAWYMSTYAEDDADLYDFVA